MTALLILNIMAIALAAAAWLSPDLLDKMGANAKARAAALRKSRKVYHATFNASMGRKPAPPNVGQDGILPRCPGAVSKAAAFISAGFGILLIVTAIAALVVMPQ